MTRPEYCPCHEEMPDPCPECGATVSGKDAVRGICQARNGYHRQPLVELVLIDKKTGRIV